MAMRTRVEQVLLMKQAADPNIPVTASGHYYT